MLKNRFNRTLLLGALLGGLLMPLGACSKDNTETPDEPETPTGSMEVLTPAASKTYLKDVATEFLNRFRAGDQRELIVLASYFDMTYADLDAPAEFEVEEDEARGALAELMRGLSRGLDNGNASRAGSAVIKYTYSLNFKRFTGIYEPGRNKWIRTSASNDIIFRFPGENGQTCEVRAQAGDSNSDFTFSVEDEEYQGYGNYQDVEYVYNCSVPKKVTVTLTSGGIELARGVVDSDLNVDGHRMNVTANVTAMNIQAAVSVSGTDTQVSATASTKVSEEVIVSSTATLNGNNLCNLDNYLDDPELTSVFKSGVGAVSVLNKVRIDGQVTYNPLVEEILDYPWWGSYDYSSKTSAESDARRAAATLNSNINAQVRYDNKETVQANLTWGVTYDDWYYSWEYGIEPLIKFAQDDTEYSFEEYFEKGFGSVEDLWSDLQSSYEKVWKSIQK